MSNTTSFRDYILHFDHKLAIEASGNQDSDKRPIVQIICLTCRAIVERADPDDSLLMEAYASHKEHDVEMATYGPADGEPANASIECLSCGVVLMDHNNDAWWVVG